MRAEDRYDSLVQYYAALNNLDWLRVKAQIKQESLFDPDAKSPVGARGLMQFMPLTWKEWQDGTPGLQEIVEELKLIHPQDPEDSIRSGCHYMRWLLRQFDQDYSKALAAYNWGIGNLKKLLARPGLEMNGPWISHLPKETATYLRKIHEYYVEYEHEQISRRIKCRHTSE
jgi:soluble lytic murein transglycosylase-like protein